MPAPAIRMSVSRIVRQLCNILSQGVTRTEENWVQELFKINRLYKPRILVGYVRLRAAELKICLPIAKVFSNSAAVFMVLGP